MPYTTEQIREKLKELHKHEDEFNREMGKNNAKIDALRKRNKKLATQVSKNMTYRNKLISQL